MEKSNKAAYDVEYTKKNVARKLITFNRNKPDDMKMWDWLEEKQNANGYIKDLIREDMIRSE